MGVAMRQASIPGAMLCSFEHLSFLVNAGKLEAGL